MNFLSQIFFNDINHGYRATILKKTFVAVSILYGCDTYFCYEKVCGTMRTAIVSNLFKSYLISLLSSNSFRMNGVCAINSNILKIGALLIISTL